MKFKRSIRKKTKLINCSHCNLPIIIDEVYYISKSGEYYVHRGECLVSIQKFYNQKRKKNAKLRNNNKELLKVIMNKHHAIEESEKRRCLGSHLQVSEEYADEPV